MKLSQAILVGIISCAVGAGATYFLMRTDNKPRYADDCPLPIPVPGDELQPDSAKKYVSNYGHLKMSVMGWVDTTGGWEIVKGQRNTRCIWFPKAEIQNMASIICRNDSLDGVRFYLANYNLKYTDTLPTREYENAPPMVYRNKTTLIMVPTWDSVPKGDTTHYHRDFIVLDSKGKVIKGRTFLRAINPENKGELCPPGDCGPDGALLLLE